MKGRCFMCYKQEKQEKYAAKLQERFDELQVPFFYRMRFLTLLQCKRDVIILLL